MEIRSASNLNDYDIAYNNTALDDVTYSWVPSSRDIRFATSRAVKKQLCAFFLFPLPSFRLLIHHCKSTVVKQSNPHLLFNGKNISYFKKIFKYITFHKFYIEHIILL